MKKKIRWIKIRKIDKCIYNITNVYANMFKQYNVYKNGVKAREPYNVYDH